MEKGKKEEKKRKRFLLCECERSTSKIKNTINGIIKCVIENENEIANKITEKKIKK